MDKSQLNIVELGKKIDRMEELYPILIKNILEGRDNDGPLIEYRNIKKLILLDLLEVQVIENDNPHLSNIRKKLQKLTINGDPFLPNPDEFDDPKFEKLTSTLKEVLWPDFDYDELRKKADWMFYSWFDGIAYVESLMKTNLLVLQAEMLPRFLEKYVSEIRECLVFQKYLASASLIRGLLDIAVTDICNKNGFDEENYETLFEKIIALKNLDKFESLVDEMHQIRIISNSILHLDTIVDGKEAKILVKDTFNLVHQLYEAN